MDVDTKDRKDEEKRREGGGETKVEQRKERDRRKECTD